MWYSIQGWRNRIPSGFQYFLAYGTPKYFLAWLRNFIRSRHMRSGLDIARKRTSFGTSFLFLAFLISRWKGEKNGVTGRKGWNEGRTNEFYYSQIRPTRKQMVMSVVEFLAAVIKYSSFLATSHATPLATSVDYPASPYLAIIYAIFISQ
jgi:hypothetical protein